LCPYLLLRLGKGIVVRSSPMTLTLDKEEVFSAAIAGVPKVAELIATVSAEERTRALKAAEKSYLETAHTLGYQDADAQQWASAVMSRLLIEEDSHKLRMLTSPPTSPRWRFISALRPVRLTRRARAKPVEGAGGVDDIGKLTVAHDLSRRLLVPDGKSWGRGMPILAEHQSYLLMEVLGLPLSKSAESNLRGSYRIIR
jgi:hypothetical protein